MTNYMDPEEDQEIIDSILNALESDKDRSFSPSITKSETTMTYSPQIKGQQYQLQQTTFCQLDIYSRQYKIKLLDLNWIFGRYKHFLWMMINCQMEIQFLKAKINQIVEKFKAIWKRR